MRSKGQEPRHLQFFIVFVCLVRFILAARFPRPCQQPRVKLAEKFCCVHINASSAAGRELKSLPRANKSLLFCETPMMARACRNM